MTASQCDEERGEERVRRQARVITNVPINQSSDKPACCSARAAIRVTTRVRRSQNDDQSEEEQEQGQSRVEMSEGDGKPE